MPKPALAVTCYVGPAHDLYHLSKVLTGLSELAASSRLELRIDPISGDTRKTLVSAAMRAVVTRDGQTMEVVFDVYDRSDFFERALLERCDIYFKRSFYRRDTQPLPGEWQPKVVPFGLNYACRSIAGETRLIESDLGLSDTLNRYRPLRPFESFEQSPDTTVERCIVFQTRAWDPETTSDDAEEVNKSRVRIVQALRKAFPRRFHGGFAPNLFNRQRYPHVLAEHPHEAGEYLAFSKRHLIGVSSRGLHQSIPFKLAEYLAASMAIVSETLRNEFAAPFIEGRNYLEFRTPDECVAQCDRLLSNPALAAELREASRRYYETEVQPARHVENLLERAFAYRGEATRNEMGVAE
ncbi:MAG TPA: glycosyltransferase [Bryobacteraceae bacterium]|nr:glycosyltransferase [Bryobacteraceae bacterium]